LRHFGKTEEEFYEQPVIKINQWRIKRGKITTSFSDCCL